MRRLASTSRRLSRAAVLLPSLPEVFLWLAAFALVAGAGLLPSVVMVNAAILAAVQQALPADSVTVLSLLLLAGASQVSVPLLGIVGLWLWIRGERLSALALGLVLVGIAIEIVLKARLAHPMVWSEFSRGFGAYPLPEIKSAGVITFVSPFPSGHMLRASFLSLVVAALIASRAAPATARVAWACAWGLIALVALGLLAFGWHWPTDVLGGLLLAAALSAPLRHSARLGDRSLLPPGNTARAA